MIFKKKSTQFTWLSALLCALFVFASMAEAGTTTVYRWRADDGSVGYSDSLKRVPKAYRSKVETRKLGSFYGYKKLTLEDSATRRKHSKAVAQRIEGLRQTNAVLENALATRTEQGLSILSGTTGKSGGLDGLVIPSPSVKNGKVIRATDIRMWDPKTQTTRTSTVYRQGDHIIYIRTPKAQRDNLSRVPTEPEYDRD